MKSYGEIRFRLRRLAPGVDLALLDGWIMDRYQRILDRLDWNRLDEVSVIQTAVPYSTGTVAVTNGSVYVTGTGTAWVDAHNGRMIRIAERGEYYAFAPNSNTTGELDRPYEGETGTAQAYVISQAVYVLSTAARLVERVTIPSLNRTLERRTPADLPPSREATGGPLYWALYMDDASFRLQVELYPVPDAVYGVLVHQVADAAGLVAGDTASTLLPWVREGALVAGVQADLAQHQKDYAGADRYEVKFEAAVADMIRTEAQRRGGVQMRMDSRHTQHRAHRWQR